MDHTPNDLDMVQVTPTLAYEISSPLQTTKKGNGKELKSTKQASPLNEFKTNNERRKKAFFAATFCFILLLIIVYTIYTMGA